MQSPINTWINTIMSRDLERAEKTVCLDNTYHCQPACLIYDRSLLSNNNNNNLLLHSSLSLVCSLDCKHLQLMEHIIIFLLHFVVCFNTNTQSKGNFIHKCRLTFTDKSFITSENMTLIMSQWCHQDYLASGWETANYNRVCVIKHWQCIDGESNKMLLFVAKAQPTVRNKSRHISASSALI